MVEDMYLTSFEFDKYLCENYGFKKAEYKIWDMDRFTKYGDLK